MSDLTPEMTALNNDFLQVAAAQGVDAAVEQFHPQIDERELQALKALSQDDLQTLARINNELYQAATSTPGPEVASDWACGALC